VGVGGLTLLSLLPTAWWVLSLRALKEPAWFPIFPPPGGDFYIVEEFSPGKKPFSPTYKPWGHIFPPNVPVATDFSPSKPSREKFFPPRLFSKGPSQEPPL